MCEVVGADRVLASPLLLLNAQAGGHIAIVRAFLAGVFHLTGVNLGVLEVLCCGLQLQRLPLQRPQLCQHALVETRRKTDLAAREARVSKAAG